MKKKIIKKIMLFFILLFIIFSPLGNTSYLTDSSYTNTTLYVGGDGPGNFSTIQNAIDYASSGDMIFVYNGEYFENIVIEKQLHLIGQTVDDTIINGGNSGDVPCIRILIDDVIIEGFSIQWADWEFHEPGIEIYSDNVVVVNNNISIHDKGIILFPSAHHAIIRNNIFSNNHESIFFWNIGSDSHIIENNFFKNNDYGIKMPFSSNNIIKNNTICQTAWDGIRITNSHENIITENTLIDNARGIIIDAESTNNMIFNNNFINNLYQVVDVGVNQWDNGYLIGGNYWDDYTGIDSDNDLIGDSSYIIPGSQNVDHFPLMKRGQWIKKPLTISSSIPHESFVHSAIQCFVNVSGGVSPYTYLWEFGDGNFSMDQNPLHHYQNSGVYMVSLTVSDLIGTSLTEEKSIIIYGEDNQSPTISIISPEPGVYLNNRKVLNLNLKFSVIIGKISIVIQAEDDESRISYIQLKIDGLVSETFQDSYVSFQWDDSNKGFYTVEIEAFDLGENSATQEIQVFKL